MFREGLNCFFPSFRFRFLFSLFFMNGQRWKASVCRPIEARKNSPEIRIARENADPLDKGFYGIDVAIIRDLIHYRICRIALQKRFITTQCIDLKANDASRQTRFFIILAGLGFNDVTQLCIGLLNIVVRRDIEVELNQLNSAQLRCGDYSIVVIASFVLLFNFIIQSILGSFRHHAASIA